MWCWEKTLESPLDSTKIKTVNPKVNHPWIFIGRTDAEAGALILWPPDGKSQLTGKDPDAGKDWSQRKKGAAEDEMVRQHHQLNGHEFEQIPGDSGGQRSLTCSSMRSQRVECYLVTEQQQIIQMAWLQSFLRSQTWASPPLLASSHWHYQDLESPRIYPARPNSTPGNQSSKDGIPHWGDPQRVPLVFGASGQAMVSQPLVCHHRTYAQTRAHGASTLMRSGGLRNGSSLEGKSNWWATWLPSHAVSLGWGSGKTHRSPLHIMKRKEVFTHSSGMFRNFRTSSPILNSSNKRFYN